MSDHAFRVYKAIRFIDENLFSAIDLSSIASAGAFSPFHFHRVFTSLMGTTVNDYVRNKRLSEAARRLLNSEQDILDLALQCQYESQEAFTRAFKQKYEINPGQLRKLKKSIVAERPFTIDDLLSVIKGDVMKPEIETRGPMRVIGIAKNYEQHSFQQATEQWGQFLSRLLEIKSIDQENLIGISMGSLPDWSMAKTDKYIYVAGVEVAADEKVPEGMVEVIFPEQTYAKFIHRGHVADSLITYRQIYNNWIPANQLEVLEAPELEIYGSKFKVESADSEYNLLIPIKK